MRDTLLLRARLQAALLSGPLAVGGVALACGPGPSGENPVVRSGHNDPGKPAAKPKPGRVAAGAAMADDAAEADDGDAADDEEVRPFAESPYPVRWGLDPYDPDAAEEEGCVNGDWCGPVDAARKFANADAGDEIGCPSRIFYVANNGAKEGDKVYKGLSFDPLMQGRIRRLSTTTAREKEGREDICCYHWFNYCSGRPLLAGAAAVACAEDAVAGLVRDEAQVAPLVEDGAWTGALGGLAEVADPALRRHLAGAWLADARMEHASIAAFARATLELLAVGAPPALVAAAQQAGIDEVEHARRCFAIAQRYAGDAAPERGPGPLPAVAPRRLDLAGLAAATFVEGCVGETIAALTATRAARRCADPQVKAALEQIAADETRHAELAWATVAWAVGSGDPSVAVALREAARALRSAEVALDVEAPFAPEVLAAHGRLDPRAQAATRDDAWREIIGPTLASILA
ncbi:MAG: hypothetical protein R3A79_25655 [Nannocystaceae bacterium]